MSESKFYKAEYAKSGRSTCTRCKFKIEQGTLRIAVCFQSKQRDLYEYKWHHNDCFIKTYQPENVNQIRHFNILHPDDKKRIKEQINGLDAKRRAEINLQNFHIEYSKNNRATCRKCDTKICKDEIRVRKTVYDTDIGMRFNNELLWHHLACFAEERNNLQYNASADELPGFAALSEIDKETARKKFIPLNDNNNPIENIKDEPKDEAQIKQERDLLEKIEEQDELFHNYKDALSKFNKTFCHSLLEENSQQKFKNINMCHNHLADCMAFGALEPCPECKNGQLVLEDYNYKCTGNLSEWTKCNYTTKTPQRKEMKFSKLNCNEPPFDDYQPKVDVRVFLHPPPTPIIDLKKDLDSGPSKSIPMPPLKNLQFFITSKLKTPKEDIKKRILKMGGLVVNRVTATTAAAISTKEQLEKMNSVMSSIKDVDVEVVEEEFLDKIDAVNGTVEKTLELIKELNIAPWGSGPSNRVPKDVISGKSVQKSGSQYVEVNKSKSVKLKIKGGAAVDPDSGLQHTAHVYQDEDGVKYSVVLSKTDIVDQKNSFYKLQVLEDDFVKKYYVFSSWGRISSSDSKLGRSSIKNFNLRKDAVDKFKTIFLEKTGNDWDSEEYIKISDRYYPVEVDYDDSETGLTNLVEDTNCKLPLPVQKLIMKVFDVNMMKMTMAEYELNTEKMPLGKLSKQQINLGYAVLTELLQHVKNEKGSRNKILDATNRFFTLIPHSFGLQNPPILDNVDAITQKTQMLDNLLEIEIAYSLLKTEGDDTKVSPIEANYLKLKAEIAPLPTDCPEFDIIKKYVANTHAATHSNYALEIVQVFKVVREGEDKRFKPFRKLHNRRLLWHGSRVTNFAGILSQGLRIAPPEAPVTGYMFGKGIYFADMVSKSANYCCTDASNPVGVLLLCEVALGDMKKCYRAELVTSLPVGTHSVWGVGRTWPDPAGSEELDGLLVPCGKPTRGEQSKLHYNEFIVYDTAQVRIKYLVQLKFVYGY